MRVDYNPIAPDYDRRYQANRLEGVEAALCELVDEFGPESVLEVGCGTCRWISSLRLKVGRAYGLDFSMGMLSQAQNQDAEIMLIRGRAGSLPYSDRSLDLVFCVNALHHFEQPEGFVAEVGRVLKPGGRLAIVGQVPQERRNRWYIYDYFEGTYATDLRRFQPWGTVLEWLIAAGFESICWNPVEWIVDNKVGDQVLTDPFLRKNAVSQLALLSDQEYQAGIRRIKDDLAKSKAQGEELVFRAELRLDMLCARRKDRLPAA